MVTLYKVLSRFNVTLTTYTKDFRAFRNFPTKTSPTILRVPIKMSHHIVFLLDSIALDPCYPKCHSQTSNLTITWKLLEIRISGPITGPLN